MKFLTILKYFFIWQFTIVVVTWAAGFFLPLREQYLGGATQAYNSNPILYSRSNFDGNLYISIAQNGYSTAQQAFFPLYPNLIRLFSKNIYPPALAGICVSAISFLSALYMFGKLLRLDCSESVTKWTIISLLLFPTSFYFTFVYTEGLFFLLIISAFYFSRTNKWFVAIILASLASYTRLVGILLLPALASELWLQKAPVRKYILLLVIPIGLLFFMNYLQKTMGDPLAFIHAQPLFGQNRSDKIILLYQVIWRYVKMLLTVDKLSFTYLVIISEFVTGIIFFALTLYGLFRQRFSYAIFSFLSVLIPTLSGTFTSLPRYVLVCFSSYILIGTVMGHDVTIKKYISILFIALGAIYLSLFVRGYWVS